MVARYWRMGEKSTTKAMRECFGVTEYYSSSSLWWLHRYTHLSELCIEEVNFTVCITYLKINGEEWAGTSPLTRSLSKRIDGLPSRDSKYPLTSQYYPYMIKLKNAPVVYGLMGTSCIFILHLMSESIQGKSLHLSTSSDLGHI